MPTSAEIRAQVVATLGAETPDTVAVLQGLAYATVQGRAPEAAIDLITSGRLQRHAPGYVFA